MNDKLAIPQTIALSVCFAGIGWWFFAYLSSWGVMMEGVFLGVGLGGLLVSLILGLIEAREVNREGEP